MSTSSNTNNELLKLKTAINDLEKKKKSSEYAKLSTQGKKSFDDMGKAAEELFNILSKIK